MGKNNNVTYFTNNKLELNSNLKPKLLNKSSIKGAAKYNMKIMCHTNKTEKFIEKSCRGVT